MPRCGSHGWLPLAGCAIALAGCSAPSQPPFPEWAPRANAFAPSPSSGNAFDGYVIAAREAEETAGDYVKYVSFQGKHKRELTSRLAPALRRIRRAAQSSCDFKFVSQPPFASNSNHVGWRLIRISLIWQIEAALAKDDLDTAINLVGLATKFGFDLANGGAADADMGLQFVDEARRAIAPRLPDLSVGQLAKLTASLKDALAVMPKFETIAQNENQNYRQSVQWVQDQYRANDFDAIDKALGNPVRDAIIYLKGVKKEDREQRPAYFDGFAKEADQFANWARSQAALPAVKRKPDKEMPLSDPRPWRRFSAQLFSTLPPILARFDATLARTRLLILTSEIHRQIKIARVAPRTLDAFSPELLTDPYSGATFKYRSTGMEFRLYSVGRNFQDDMGNTDSIYASPDLTLETSRR
ncbi:MAG: hypothetical protein H7Y17_16075 [Chlorobia bacterium]|nr:hypothetical protein [Fimbriimonadaceae bacterium]